jgi:hypothetical protein
VLVAIRVSASVVVLAFMVMGIALEVPDFFNVLVQFGFLGTCTAILSVGVLLVTIAIVGRVLWDWATEQPYVCQGC